MKKELILIFFLLISLILTGQQPSQELGPMPDIVFETSGLIFYNGKLVTHNDSGNTPQLFEIDTVSLEITRTVTLKNVENVDWEDIAQDDLYIYIGDFGNNLGTRQDLAIYRIAKSDYNGSDSVMAEVINFEYEDQVDFTNVGNSDWDAEALFVLNDLYDCCCFSVAQVCRSKTHHFQKASISGIFNIKIIADALNIDSEKNHAARKPKGYVPDL